MGKLIILQQALRAADKLLAEVKRVASQPDWLAEAYRIERTARIYWQDVEEDILIDHLKGEHDNK